MIGKRERGATYIRRTYISTWMACARESKGGVASRDEIPPFLLRKTFPAGLDHTTKLF